MGFLDAEIGMLPRLDEHNEQWQEWEKVRPGTISRFERVLGWYRAIGEEDPEELWPNSISEVKQTLQNHAQQLSGLPALDPGNADWGNLLGQLDGSLANLESWWRQSGRSLLRGPVVGMATAAADAHAIVEQIKADAAQVAELREQVQQSVQEIQTLEVAEHYSKQAANRGTAANRALGAVIVFGVLLVVGGAIFVNTIPDTSEGQWTEFAREALLRAFVLGALSYGVVFAARIYRTNSHLRAVYDQKATALKTFVVFSQTIDDPDARTLILAELVRSVFSAADTGVLDKGGTERTIIDSVPGIAAALTSSRGSK